MKVALNNIDDILKLVKPLPRNVFIKPINLLGGGGKYGRTIKGIKGIQIYGYLTVRTPPGSRKSTKDILQSRRVLMNKAGYIDIETVKKAIKDIANMSS